MKVDEEQKQGLTLLYKIMSDATRCGRPIAPKISLATDRAGKERSVNKIESYWINLLHQAFLKYYPADEFDVFSKVAFNAEFKLNEFLFDLMITQKSGANVLSPDRHISMPVIADVIWQVESEMAGNGREVAVDLGKLVCGNATNKLLIVRNPTLGKSAPVSKMNDFIIQLSAACTGNLFVAYVPVYAKGHSDYEAIYLKPEIAMPFKLFARIRIDDAWTMTSSSDLIT